MSQLPPSVTPEAFQNFRLRQRRIWRAVVFGLILLAVAAFFAVGDAWSYIAGLVALVAVTLSGFEVVRRWNRRRWLQRFPELDQIEFPWRKDAG